MEFQNQNRSVAISYKIEFGFSSLKKSKQGFTEWLYLSSFLNTQSAMTYISLIHVVGVKTMLVTRVSPLEVNIRNPYFNFWKLQKINYLR